MHDLNCTEFEARLMQAVENRQTLGDFGDEANPKAALWQVLRDQANACPHCRKLWNEFALLDRVLPVWKSQLPQVNLTDAVMTRWHAEQSAKSEVTLKRTEKIPVSISWQRIFALAMAVVLIAALPFLFRQRPADLPEMVPIAHTDFPLIEEESTSHAAQTPPTEVPELDADWQVLAQDAGSAYWALAHEAADSLASVRVFVPPQQTKSTLPEPKEVAPSSGWAEGIGNGFKPIGKDVGRAMGFLFDALPGDAPTL